MNTDWMLGLLGGTMIGLAAAVYLLGAGRIMGASGIFGSVVDGSAGSTRNEKLAFLAGLAFFPLLLVWLGLGAPAPAVTSLPVLAVAGLLVGYGTRMANGCTSGHGVCGISRLSIRGIAATVTYLLTGGLALLISRALGLGV